MRRDSSIRIDDDKLPIYTIICALYREANVVGNLVAAIRALDYPAEKLDVKFVLEADDHDTRRVLARLDLGPPFEIIAAPPIGPRTKPKALNVALPLARGSFTVVYDAEDAPERDQLRRAVAAFMASDDQLACLQASLTIDNTADNWLARMFTANYAGQFDVFLPGLAALRLPFPLGGSSNHFRTSVLRRSAAGIPTMSPKTPISAFVCIASATARRRCRRRPTRKRRRISCRGSSSARAGTRAGCRLGSCTCAAQRRLMRELTPAGAIAFQLFLACNVLAALVHPFFMAATLLFAARAAAAAGRRRHGPGGAGVRRDVSRRLCLDGRA